MNDIWLRYCVIWFILFFFRFEDSDYSEHDLKPHRPLKGFQNYNERYYIDRISEYERQGKVNLNF